VAWEALGAADPNTPGDEFFEGDCSLNGYLAERDVDWRTRFGVATAKDSDYRGGAANWRRCLLRAFRSWRRSPTLCTRALASMPMTPSPRFWDA
jgi:hypothetical protein